MSTPQESPATPLTQQRRADQRLLARCRGLADVAARTLVGAGVLVIVGWAVELSVLRSLIPGLVAMNPATAVAFVLGGIALHQLNRAAVAQRRSRVAALCAVIVILLGASRLAAYVTPYDLALDQWLFAERLGSNRMAPNTAFNFVVDGLALLLLSLGLAIGIAQSMVLLAAVIAFIALLGYLYQVPLTGLPGYIPMALNTALCFLVVEFGMLCARADSGPIAAFISGRSGGRAARQLLPAVIALPVGLGWLALSGQRLDWFPGEFGIALLVTGAVVTLVALVYLAAQRLNAGDEEVEHLLTTDTLTGVLNRRAVMECLGVETAEALRYNRPLSTAMVDIDHFKKINDSYGHPGGDEVLRCVGRVLRESLTERFVAGRFGGEEFIVVLPETTLDGAAVYGEALRARIAKTAIALPGGEPIRITCSVGVAEVLPQLTPQPERALKLADDALYEAKRAGRNRVQAAEIDDR